MAISYDEGKKLELWTRDEGILEGYTIYVNGTRFKDVGDGGLKQFPINRPPAVMVIAALFGGKDGGHTAIVDVTDPSNRVVLERKTGLDHVYEIEP